jgi:hypothetical protein
MAIEQRELRKTTSDNLTNQLMIVWKERTTVSFNTDAGASELAAGYPVGYDVTTGYYDKWAAPAPSDIAVAGATAGQLDVTVNGVAVTGIAWNATAAAIAAAFAAIGHDVSVTSDNNGTFDVVFDSNDDITAAPALIITTPPTGGTAVATDGTSTNGTHIISGFVWPEPVTLSATENAMQTIMTKGDILKFDEIKDLVDPADQAALEATCKSDLLAKGIIVREIANIHTSS